MSTFLVTGSAGFIGSSLVDALLDQGHDVVGLDNFSGGFQDNVETLLKKSAPGRYTFLDGDIRDLTQCREACKGVDYVLHQAALGSVPRSMEEPLMYEENNVQGLLNMLVSAKDAGVKRFVFASSSSVYGDTPTLPKVETQWPTPKSPYAVNKLAGEYYCSMFYQSYGLPTVALRYFNVFGPRQNPHSQYSAVIPKFITAFLKGESPVIYGDGEQTRDFTYIDNVVDTNLAACFANEQAFGQAMNVGCGARISVNTLAHNIKELTKSKADIRYEASRVGDVKDSLADISRLTTLLEVHPKVQLEEGLAKTVEWYRG